MSIILIVLFLFATGFGYWLKYLNLSHLKAFGHIVPPEFRDAIDPDLLAKISDYTIENNRFGIVESAINSLILLVFLFGGILGWYDRWISSLTGSFVLNGVLFVLILAAAEGIIGIPFSLYHHFRIEARYGFNAMTFRLWLADLGKSIVISALLGAAVTAGALLLVSASPGWWWFWVWGFFLVFGVFMMYVSPYLIEPLFFKFEPIRAEGLEDRIRGMMNQAGITVSRVFQVDASRRSRHSNAYFTGIGRVKRIVLFDTLIGQMSQDEILAVLAHEVGHWRKRHVLKGIIVAEATAFVGLFIAFHLVSWTGLPRLVGLQDASFFARILILGFLGSLIMFPLTPLFSFLSRRREREADRFASELTANPEAMASALIKLSKENLSNLHPHPWYAAFYYSHPPVIARVRELRGKTGSQEGSVPGSTEVGK